MTVVIKSDTANFSGSNLVISPIVSDGLRAAYRFNDGRYGLLDESGNNSLLTEKGSPQLKANSIVGDKSNGYITDIPDSNNLTMITVSRLDTAGALFGFVGGSYHSANKTGFSLYYVSRTTDGTKYIDLTLQIFNGLNYNSIVKTVATGVTEGSPLQTDWIWVAVTIDENANAISAYIPSIQDAAIAVTDFSDKTVNLADRILDGNLQIATVPAALTSANGSIGIAEALIYDKVLTTAQIKQQYLWSQRHLAANSSINI